MSDSLGLELVVNTTCSLRLLPCEEQKNSQTHFQNNWTCSTMVTDWDRSLKSRDTNRHSHLFVVNISSKWSKCRLETLIGTRTECKRKGNEKDLTWWCKGRWPQQWPPVRVLCQQGSKSNQCYVHLKPTSNRRDCIETKLKRKNMKQGDMDTQSFSITKYSRRALDLIYKESWGAPGHKSTSAR